MIFRTKTLALAALTLAASGAWAQGLQKITINYPTRSGASWPMYIAKEGGYYQKYGLDVNLQFGVHPAGIAMLVSGEAAEANYSLEQSMDAAAKANDSNFVMMGTSLNKALFALMARKDLMDIKQLKGKRLAIGQVGDAPYNYTVALLSKYKIGVRDVQWIPVGTDVSGRAAALVAGRADATLLTAPNYFRLEEQGYKNLANLADHDDIYAATVYLFRRNTITANPKLPEQIIKAQAEAIKRFYDDKAFAIKAYIAFDKQPEADIEKIYDRYQKGNLFERIPYVLSGAVKAVVAQQSDPQLAAPMQAFDFHKVVDNSMIDRLVKEGYFEQVFGPGIKAEEEKRSKAAFR
ncbi:MAG: ABC transporter substrate-binding protein [Bryobacterales bacterium]|nr:ABC transporter substrate-binding protein [Bryobacterales bacterium]MBV9400770.1 ABC transporter substrate-binding protein [Bryobacterales bacterium]